MQPALEIALHLVKVLEQRRAEYDAMNGRLRGLMPEFTTHVQHMDSQTETALVALLDELILPQDKDTDGQGIASYYLYELGQKAVIVNGKHYPLGNWDQLREYVEAMHSEEGVRAATRSNTH